ncbi:MAG: hypothetical protein F4229_10575 [Gammaproteobacteria bacterium]|nr:hypothetical protein [Gammaproteobacteria bacterium]
MAPASARIVKHRGRWHRWRPIGRRRPSQRASVVMYTSDTPQKMGLRDRALMRYRIWQHHLQHRRKLRAYELPGFYRRAKQRDVEGLAIRGGSWTVGDFLPEGFEAYVRLPNPFWKVVPPNTAGAVGFEPGGGEGTEGHWAKPIRNDEVAQANGLRMTHDARWGAICGAHDGHFADSPDQVWSWAPHECNIEPFVAETLFRLLANESGRNDRCLCGQWEGGSRWDTDVLLVTRGWTYFVWRARLRDVAAWLQRPDSSERNEHIPHIIWPTDRNWCLATLYSGHSNYLAGTRTMIDAVLSSELEAYGVALTDRAH